MEPFWNQSPTIQEGETRFWHLGPLQLWVHRLPGEWQIAYISNDEDCDDSRWIMAEPSTFPTDLPTKRIALDSTAEDNTISLRPALPDRPIVSRPNQSLSVPSGTSAEIVCGVPLWVELVAGKSTNPVKLTSLPIRELSKTWFGTALEGEPCYASSTRAVLDYRELEAHGFRILCPISIRNGTSETLPIDRICIRVEHLGVYEGVNYLWSNRMKVEKIAIHATSRLTFENSAPAYDPSAKLVVKPRVKATKSGMINQTFNHLRSFIGDN